MTSSMLLLSLLVLCLSATVHCYINTPSSSILVTPRGVSSALFAHHVQKKITKRMMDRRPKKSRPSDITRNNVNFGKCITKVEGAPTEYTLLSAEDYMKVREEALLFWENGDPNAEWLEVTEEDMSIDLCPNVEPLPVGGVQKRPPLVRSGTW